MTFQEKTDHLASLSEDKLRLQVLLPLLNKIGFIDPIVHHHSGEKGKDIVCKEIDDKLGKTRYVALVVKAGNVNGSVSGSNSYFTVLNQIRQAINEPYKHIYEIREVAIDQVIVVVSGTFLPTSLESIYHTLKAEKIDKVIRDTIDVRKLVGLLDKSFPEYWTERDNQTESLIRQRNFLLNNLAKMLAVLVPDPSAREKALMRLGSEEFEVELNWFRTMARYMVDIGYRRIGFDEIDAGFTEPFLNAGHHEIKRQFFDFKNRVKKILYEIDEGVEPLKQMLVTTNPKELAKLCEDLEYHTSQGGRLSYDISDAGSAEEISEAVAVYEARKGLLETTGCGELYGELMRDLRKKLPEALVAFYSTFTKSDRDRWIGYRTSFSLKPPVFLASNVNTFQEAPRLLKDEGHFKTHETSRVRVSESYTLEVEYAPYNFGFFKEEKLTMEQKAEEFMWHYERSFADRFFELLENSTD